MFFQSESWCFAFDFRSTAFRFLLFALPLLPLRFSLLLPAIRPTAPLPVHSPLSLFLSANHQGHQSLIKLFHLPPRSSLPAFHLSPLPGHHRYYPSRQLSLGPSALLFSAFSQTQLGSETNGMRVLVKLVERKTWGLVVGRWHRGLRISSGAMLVLV